MEGFDIFSVCDFTKQFGVVCEEVRVIFHGIWQVVDVENEHEGTQDAALWHLRTLNKKTQIFSGSIEKKEEVVIENTQTWGCEGERVSVYPLTTGLGL